MMHPKSGMQIAGWVVVGDHWDSMMAGPNGFGAAVYSSAMTAGVASKEGVLRYEPAWQRLPDWVSPLLRPGLNWGAEWALGADGA